MSQENQNLTIKIAETDAEVLASQRLRYRVFVTELGAETDPESAAQGIESDAFDSEFDHLILQDKTLPNDENVVGVYRLMQGEVAKAGAGFYSASEFDLTKLNDCGRKTLELGRSCIDARYRGGTTMHLLWGGLADYVMAHDIEILFGVASFHGTDPAAIEDALTFLNHRHLAPPDLRIKAHGASAVSMDLKPFEQVDRAQAARQIPSLIKSYLRLGGCVGQDAFIDHAFNTIDVCLVMDTAKMTDKYKFLKVKDRAT